MKTPKMVETEKHNITPGRIYIKGDLPAKMQRKKKKKVTTANIILFTEEISGLVIEFILFQKQV